MRRTLHTCLLLGSTVAACAQWDSISYSAQDTSQVLYDGGFDFREGIYFGFEDFRANRPAVELKDLRTDQDKPVTDLRQSNGKLYYTDTAGTRQRILLDRTWGFCNRDVVYVRSGDGFNRIGIMGSISHLVFEKTSSNYSGFFETLDGAQANQSVMQQCLLDMSAGSYLDVNAKGIEIALQNDAELLAEFQALPKKGRWSREVIFRFMRRYNERHPLYFPR